MSRLNAVWFTVLGRAFVLGALIASSACSSLGSKSPEVSSEETAQAIQNQRKLELFARAKSFHEEGQLAEAERAYLVFLSEYPEALAARINLARIHISEGEDQKAKAYLLEALSYRTERPEIFNALGVLARKNGDFSDAEQYYRKALQADSRYVPALRNLAILLDLYLGRLEEALALYEQLQGLDSEEDRKLKDWIFDLKRQIEAKG